MRDIIGALLQQVRDTVGADVTENILQEIKDKLDPMVHRRVRSDMRKVLLAPPQALIDGKSQKP